MRLRRLLILLILIGLAVLGWLYFFQSHQTCFTKQKICLTYDRQWKQAKVSSPVLIHLTEKKPTVLFQASYSDQKSSGSTRAVATLLDRQLKQNLPGYNLITSNQLGVSKVLSVELLYDFNGPNGAPMRQQLIVTAVGGHTYLFTTEAAAKDYDKVKPKFDRLLQNMEIKK